MNTLAALAPQDLLTVHRAEHRAVAATSAADAARLATLRAAVLGRVADVQSLLVNTFRPSTASPDLCCA